MSSVINAARGRAWTGACVLYLRYNTSIALVPIVAQDAPFIFNEATRDFQVVAIQGSLLYRITAPLNAARAVNYAIDTKTGRYRSDDPAKLGSGDQCVQGHTRAQVIDLPLEQALTKVKDLAADVLARIQVERCWHRLVSRRGIALRRRVGHAGDEKGARGRTIGRPCSSGPTRRSTRPR